LAPEGLAKEREFEQNADQEGVQDPHPLLEHQLEVPETLVEDALFVELWSGHLRRRR